MMDEGRWMNVDGGWMMDEGRWKIVECLSASGGMNNNFMSE